MEDPGWELDAGRYNYMAFSRLETILNLICTCIQLML